MFRGAVRPTPGGALLDVSVLPDAPRTGVRGYDPWRGRARIRVEARPSRGEANEELLVFLAKVAGVPRADVGIEVGVASRWKTIRFARVSPDALARALETSVSR